MAEHGELIAHLRRARRCLSQQLAQRRQGLPGVGGVETLEKFVSLVEEEYALWQRDYLAAAGPRRLTIGPLVSDWPAEHPLRIALEGVQDLAWRPLDTAL